ncbi:MAG: heat-inducible transcriptional repressor HrcA [Proteobacteria bacterium]|jgi:heat-inducible transcriptional repressor|nr:heat-inducible transcriptional repressor HrcA [Pseudomonadota bacterium]
MEHIDLSERERRVLFAAIAEYVSSGVPVSSRLLSDRALLGLSPPTIRRALHDLTVAGLLVQPHTSAGRIPTDRAFRIFVDALRESAVEVDPDARRTLFEGVANLVPGEIGSWRDIVGTLSEISAQTALVITPALSDSQLRQLRFVPIEPGKLLAVVVTREGIVHNAFVESPADVDDRELERIHNYLSEKIAGRSLNEVRTILRREMEDARARCDALRERASRLGAEALSASAVHGSHLLVEGRSHLFDRPELEGRLAELMGTLDKKARLLDLLDKAAATDRGPLVLIGDEGGAEFEGCALVTAPFGATGSGGQVGIIGSARMDYRAALPLVSLSAQILSSLLKASRG